MQTGAPIDNASLQSFVQMLGHLREPLLIVSRSGRIVAANAAGAEALGTSFAALRDTPLASYSSDPEGLSESLRHARAERPFRVQARDGRRFLCDTSPLTPDLFLARLSGGPEAEPRARRFFETLSRLYGVTAADTLADDEVPLALLTEAADSVAAAAGGIFLVDEGGANLELKVKVRYPESHADRYRLIPLSSDLPIVDTIRHKEPIFLGGLEDYASRYPEFAAAHPEIARNGFVSLPLVVAGHCFGAIALGFGSRRTYAPAERDLLVALADRCAKALEHTRWLHTNEASLQLAERASRRLERLHAFTGALAKAITPAQVVETVVDMGMAAASARSGGLWLLSADGALASLARSVGPSGPRSEHFQDVSVARPSRMPVLDALRDGAPVWIESCQQLEERYPDAFRAFSRGKQTSLASVPLFAEGRCIGALALGFDVVHRFLEDERAFLQVIAWYSAQAIERARLYAAEKQAREEAEANQRRSAFLADVGTLLAGSLDYSNIFADVARAIVPRVADWCVIELADERLRGIPPVAAHVDPSKVSSILELSRRRRSRPDSGKGIADVIRSGTSRLHRAISPELLESRLGAAPSPLHDLVAHIGAGSAVAVPISARGTALGAIALVRIDPAHPYDERDLAMAEELGRRVGLAVDNARLYQEACDADRLKDEFLAMLSHELRNPLAPIQTALELMALRDSEHFARERGVIARNLQRVVGLVNDLLDVSRITRGKVRLDMERCELATIIEAAVEMTRPLIEARGQQLTISVPEHELPIDADPTRLAQAVANLLTNAAKYTEPRGDLAVRAFAQGAEAVVEVQDSGIGIEPELLPRVFDLFVQAKSTLDRAQGGLGIGLTVVKSVVELHAGKVLAHSAGLGTGSTFTIRLPLAGRDTSTPPADQSSAPHLVEPRRVLAVDDNEDAAQLLGEAIEALGCSARVGFVVGDRAGHSPVPAFPGPAGRHGSRLDGPGAASAAAMRST